MAKSKPNKQNKTKTKEIEYAVKYLHENKKMSSTDISLELGVAEAIVDGIINQPKEAKPQRVSKSQNLMTRHTASKNINNVSVMTEAASQLNDELVKNLNSTNSRTSQNAIFRPNG
jgi:hypothetical protein